MLPIQSIGVNKNTSVAHKYLNNLLSGYYNIKSTTTITIVYSKWITNVHVHVSITVPIYIPGTCTKWIGSKWTIETIFIQQNQSLYKFDQTHTLLKEAN